MGTTCSLRWRESGEHERLWNLSPDHPVMAGIGDRRAGPGGDVRRALRHPADPEALLMIGWFPGGEVFRSVCALDPRAGAGRVLPAWPRDAPDLSRPECAARRRQRGAVGRQTARSGTDLWKRAAGRAPWLTESLRQTGFGQPASAEPIRWSRAGVSTVHRATSTTPSPTSRPIPSLKSPVTSRAIPKREWCDGRQDVADQQHQRGRGGDVGRSSADVDGKGQDDREDGTRSRARAGPPRTAGPGSGARPTSPTRPARMTSDEATSCPRRDPMRSAPSGMTVVATSVDRAEQRDQARRRPASDQPRST